MSHAKSKLIPHLAFLLLLATNSLVAQTPLNYDQELIGTISSFGEIDEYSFWGTQGDKILIRMRDAETGIDACMELYDPTGTMVASDCGDGGTVRIADFELTATGNFILKVWDNNHNDTGDYGVALQVLNNPEFTQEINCGDDLVATLDQTVEIDAYAFSAAAGDNVTIRMRSTSTYFESKLILYDPSGAIVDQAVGASGGPTRLSTENLPVDGVYTILAMDNSGNDTGEYGLSFQITSLSSCAEPISCSADLPGNISQFVEMDAYLMTAFEGEDVMIQMRKLNSSIEAQIEVYKPDGSLLHMIKSPNSSLCRLKLDDLPMSGDYMILLMDAAGNDKGDYSFSVQRLGQPDCAFSLNCQTIDGAFNLDHYGEMDAYTIAVNAGDVATFVMKDLGISVEPMLELYDPTGNLIAADHQYVTTTLENIVFPVDGIYTLLAMDKSGNDTGPYSLSVLSDQVGIGDNLPPTLAYQNLTMSLDEFGVASMDAADLDNGSTDACGDLSFEVNYNTFTCADIGTNEVTFVVSDNSGNTASAIAAVTIVDDLAPSINAVPADITVNCNSIPSAPSLTASDNCKGNWVANFEELVNTGCPYTIVRIWSATDDYGNATSAVQTVTVEDIEAPNLNGIPGNTSVTTSTIPSVANVTASDNCSSNLSVEFTEVVGDGCPYLITRTWTVVDDCGNTKSASQEIWVEDNEGPVFSNLPEDITIECTECVQAFINSDFEDFQLSGGWGYVNGDNLPGWSTTAASGNIEIQKSGSVDGVVSYSGNYHAELNSDQVGDFYQEFCTIPTTTLSVSFAHHKRMSSNNTTPDKMEVLAGADTDNLSSLGIFTVDGMGWQVNHVTYAVPAGQTSTVFLFRAVQGAPNADTYGNLIDDISAITLFGPTMPTVEEEGVSIEVDEQMITGACSEHYQLMRSWLATDECGNTSTVSQLLTVGDFTAPVFDNAPADLTVACGEVPVVAELTATDNCASSVTISFEETASATSCPYVLTRTWQAVDDCGNATVISQAITVEAGGVEEAYCETEGSNSSYEWINKITFAGLDHLSGDDSGYGDFTSLTATVTAGENYDITLEPGYASTVYEEYWSVWVDWNKDGDFEDEGELSFTEKGENTLTGNINIPSDASGVTRMRIAMKYNGYADPCGDFTYGEVEDYLVEVLPGEPCGDLPEDWSNTDIGDTNTPGSACYDAATASYTVNASGYDIFGTSDDFHFVYTSFCGDGDLIARVRDITNTDENALAGIMMRRNMNKGAKNASLVVSPENGISFQARLTKFGYTYSGEVAGAAPTWLKLSRDGSQFSGYISNDGVNWTPAYYADINMSNCISIGLVVASHNDDMENSSLFDQVSIVAASDRNQPNTTAARAQFPSLTYDCTQEIEHRGEIADCPEFNEAAYNLAQTVNLNSEAQGSTSPDFHVFPNPADYYTELYLGPEWEGDFSVEIYNQLGQRIFLQQHSMAEDRRLSLDLGRLHLGNGYYTLTIRQNDKVTTKTLVIAH